MTDKIFYKPLFFTKTPESVFLKIYYNSTRIVGDKAIVWWLGKPGQNGCCVLFDYNIEGKTFWVSNKLLNQLDEFEVFDYQEFLTKMAEKHLHINVSRII